MCGGVGGSPIINCNICFGYHTCNTAVWSILCITCVDNMTVYFCHIWLGVWILNYGFREDALGFEYGNEIR